ncbi:MAG: hypothetical protein ACI8UO_001058 [Verrucomicrobiales bacterium]
MKNWLWGYDFFISYHWKSGGTYAVNLAAQLRDRGFDVFLDRAEYAMGDDWKKVGAIALRNTRRLVLVATREAVFESEPVEREVQLFTDRKRHCIPIFFGETFEKEKEKNAVLKRLSDATLYQMDEARNLPNGPPEKVIEKLAAAHGIMRRRRLRTIITLTAICILAVFAVAAIISGANAKKSKAAAFEHLTRSFTRVIGQAEEFDPVPSFPEREALWDLMVIDSGTEEVARVVQEWLKSPSDLENASRNNAVGIRAAAGRCSRTDSGKRELFV